MADLTPNTPVLIGVAAVQQKLEDFERAREPVQLMEQSLRDAVHDAVGADRASQLIERVEEILIPKGMWAYSDPARMVADGLGASAARTLLGEIGISQQHLINRACHRIANGEVSVAMVTGGEARYRELCAKKAGTEVGNTPQEGVEPDLTLHPDSELWSAVESATGLGMPVGYYAIIDSALRFKQGLSVDEHRDQMAQTYERFSEIAAQNPDAWVDAPVSAEFIRNPSARNRMLAFPYTKLHNSQWNVDQAAGMVFCSVAMAEQLDVPREKWVFPRASAESNFMSVVAARKDLGGCAGFRLAGEKAMAMAGIDFDEIRLREFYSCFPAAVRSQVVEFGMSGAGDLSVTGAMTFGGGPLNNFVYQSTVKMAQLLREQPQEVGLVTTVSGMLTKQACTLWSSTPNPGGWDFADVTEQVREQTELCEVVADFEGSACVAGYTVLYQGDAPWRAVAVFDLPENCRTVAYSEDKEVIDAMLGDECCDKTYVLSSGQFST